MSLLKKRHPPYLGSPSFGIQRTPTFKFMETLAAARPLGMQVSSLEGWRLWQGLRDLGYIENPNVIIELRYAEGGRTPARFGAPTSQTARSAANLSLA